MLRKVTGSTILYQHYHHQHRRRRLFDVTVYPQSNVSPSTAQAVSAAHLASMGYYSRFSFFVFFGFFSFSGDFVLFILPHSFAPRLLPALSQACIFLLLFTSHS